ncbi:MAG: hypothetical protein ACOCRX_03325 [Candidatus Woesearchaeota archaeon]
MIIKLNLEDIKSIDNDYKYNKFFHKGERVKIVNPDHKYYGKKGIYQGFYYDDEKLKHIYKVEIKEVK